ncbi:MAG: hypothetical protein KDH09_12975 [Chrysiogenetes bacterium]|nr:hypothetical protein [Chrysiogenetes bacterium]
MESAKGVLKEHQDINILVRDLGKVVQWEVTLLSELSVRGQLRADLIALCVQLERHFATEEAGHYLEEIGRRDPGARDELAALQDEHPTLMELFIQAQKACDHSSHEAMDKLKEILRRGLHMLQHHEQRETALVRKVFGG